MKIAIIGDGGWGTALSIHLSSLGHRVRLWGAFPEYIEVLRSKRENIKFLQGIKIPEAVYISPDMEEILEDSELLLLAVPSRYLRSVLENLTRYRYPEKCISATKGLEEDTLLRMSEIIMRVLENIKLAVLSGPSIAYEVAKGMPTTVVVASEDRGFAKEIQNSFMSGYFRLYTSSDIIGVELGGALKNVIAIASGIGDGLGFGANSKAAILTRGVQEITRLGLAMGARPETFSGLSCTGDLITTCMSPRSRNRWFGEEIGRGKRPDDILNSTEMAIEGVTTVKSAYMLSKKFNIDMPITNEIYEIIYRDKDPKKAVSSLMGRVPKDEFY